MSITHLQNSQRRNGVRSRLWPSKPWTHVGQADGLSRIEVRRCVVSSLCVPLKPEIMRVHAANYGRVRRCDDKRGTRELVEADRGPLLAGLAGRCGRSPHKGSRGRPPGGAQWLGAGAVVSHTTNRGCSTDDTASVRPPSSRSTTAATARLACSRGSWLTEVRSMWLSR